MTCETCGYPLEECNCQLCHECGERVELRVQDDDENIYRCRCGNDWPYTPTAGTEE
jgi:hypothetical protein